MPNNETARLIFKKIDEGWNKRREIIALGRYLKSPIWVLLPGTTIDTQDLKQSALGEHLKKISIPSPKKIKVLRTFLEHTQRSLRNRGVEQFAYWGDFHALCYPLMFENDDYGVIIMCGMKKSIKTKLEGITISIFDTIAREVEKEVELEELNETIRPRAIALSTVHTVHRLMGATLEINELLPRIARLALQVLSCNRCSIKLLNKSKRTLLPMCTIDLRKKTTKLKKVEIGKYAPGKAVKREASVRGERYLATPLIDEDTIGVITLYDKLDGKPFTVFDEEIMKTMAEQGAIAIKNAQLFQDQEELTTGSIRCISQLLETRAHSSHRPEASFFKLISLIGRYFDMNEAEIKKLQYAAMLHDAGQIGIPEKVLMKRKELTKEEYDIIKMHPMKGASILSKVKTLQAIRPIILYHHENYNGSGYPRGLKGEGIPLAARILAVVASFEAMITKRPYRKALSISAAIKEVQKASGIQFDPKVVKIFCEAVARKDVKRLLVKELNK